MITAEDMRINFMIWPEFQDESGNVITQRDTPVPVSGKARMWIINDGLRKYHQDKIKIGLKANGHEGVYSSGQI